MIDYSDDMQMLKVKDLQNILNVGRERAYALMKTKGFPAIQIGKTYVVSKASLKEWVENNEGRKIIL